MSYLQQLEPLDEFNQALQSNVHPLAWTNPTPSGRTFLIRENGEFQFESRLNGEILAAQPARRYSTHDQDPNG